MKPWTILSSKQVLRDQFMGLRTDRCMRDDGHIVETYHVTELTEWVTVIPLTASGNVVLIREYRHAAGVFTLGLPGGVSDPGETDWPAVGARELREETGYSAQEMHHVGTCYPNPATQNNRLHYYLALGCRLTGSQSLDPNEQIEVLEMPYTDFLEYGTLEVQHALHAAALFYTERFLTQHPNLRPAK
ncbi:NUDIX hydrolase [Hyphomonas sp.]|uniref:NUDIX hydrolase n=1 Tax=Hyphomonas sp. TaxID=87 RepID=UPI003527D94F